MKPIVYGKVLAREFIPNDQELYKKVLGNLEGKDVQLTVDTVKRGRSLNQNSYYWGVCLKLLSDHTGHSESELHEILKFMFLRERSEIKTKKGTEKFTRVKSTTELNTVAMENYLAEIRIFASLDLNCYLPLPNEVEV